MTLTTPIGEIMTKPVISVKVGESLKNLFKLMDDHGILGVPVVDEQEKVVGIVTESDLIRNVTTLKSPFAITLLGSIVYLDDLNEFNQTLKDHCAKNVSDIMTKEVISVDQAKPLSQAIDLMAEHKISRLPVTDGDGRLTGILTRSDVVHQLAKLK